MNTFQIILRNLWHFRAASLAVTAGMAVATAVLTGALMVGDSVKGSLAELAVQRLGKTDYALVGGRLFGDSLAGRLAPGGPLMAEPVDEFVRSMEVVPALILNGGASVGEGNARLHVGDVQILATGTATDGADWVKVDRGNCIVNEESATALWAKPALPGGPVVFTFPSLDTAPRDAIVAKRERQDAVASLRVEKSAVASDRGMASLFNLAGGQRVPRNAWVNLRDLQEAVDQPGRANALLVHELEGKADPKNVLANLNKRLREVVTLEDYGLEVKKPASGRLANGPSTTITSSRSIPALRAPVVSTHMRTNISYSPGGAAESSPRRKPGVTNERSISPGGAKEGRIAKTRSVLDGVLSPLRGWREILPSPPGLRPGLLSAAPPGLLSAAPPGLPEPIGDRSTLLGDITDQLRPFHLVMETDQRAAPEPVAPPEWNLINKDRDKGPWDPTRAYWSLQIMAFRANSLREKAAVSAVAALREKGVEAYFYHGDTVSSVCVGAWPIDAIELQKNNGNDAAHPDFDDHRRKLEAVEPVGPVPNIVDNDLKETIRKYPFHAVNYEINKRATTDGGEREAPSFLVVIPRPRGNGYYDSDAVAPPEAALVSRSTYLEPSVLAAAQKAAADIGITPRLVAVNLVNAAVKLGPDGKPAGALHYIIAAGISALDDGPLKDDEIAFNEATAKQLNVSVGDTIRLDYFKRQSNGELTEVKSSDAGLTFHVVKILPMTGLAVDRTLTPVYKGMTDAPSVSDWHPPRELRIDEKLAEKDNDAYWKKYKAAPRLFVSLAAARKMWGGAYGDVTSLRVPAEKADAFAVKLRETLDPASLGMVFRPVKAEQIAAASAGGADQFGMIFVSLSFFLIGAAGLLVAMLFRLNIEQRARQVGLMAALGFTPRKLRGIALAEGMVLAIVGGVAGLAGAVGYTALIVYGLRTWWVGAVGTTALHLHVRADTLCDGLVSGIVVAFFAVLWGAWRVGRTPPARLLAGAWNVETPGKVRGGRVTRLIGWVLTSIGAATLALIFLNVIKGPEMALAGGAVLLAGGLCWLAGALRPNRRASPGLSSVTRLGVRNASRHTARSVLSAGLIAFAVFTLVIVASMRQGTSVDTSDPKSGAGGYQVFFRASVPLLGDIDTPEGRKLLGVDESNPIWGQSHFLSMRRWAGEDVSCLNLMHPTSPTILAAPHKLVEQNRFSFASKGDGNQWAKLEQPPDEKGAVPIIADGETADYILNLKVNESIEITDSAGAKRKLKLVATLNGSVFQSELLMGDANFREMFPSQAGFGVVLAETEPKNVQPLELLLNKELDDYGVSVDTTAARLASYQQVANTYLSTFQVLGSLGLMLGTIGLAVVLVRNVIERRPELALLAAIGFRPGDRAWLILSENAFLLLIGLILGAACAILGVMPTVLGGRGAIAVKPLATSLLLVLVIGLSASVLAVRLSGLRPKPGDLRNE